MAIYYWARTDGRNHAAEKDDRFFKVVGRASHKVKSGIILGI